MNIDPQFYTKVRPAIAQRGPTILKQLNGTSTRYKKTGITVSSGSAEYNRQYARIRRQNPEYKAKAKEWNRNYYMACMADPVKRAHYKEVQARAKLAVEERQKEKRCPFLNT